MAGWGQRSAVGPLAKLLLPPGFQDDVASVSGVLVRQEGDVESSEERM